ncbi:hypothetical protein J7T55_012908 [Diaporthe amygdali]|uniref:uncharacterized protein n=1 Tax=Phomopsis amygdali TaxID=1214568 RepID=UPI0022FE8B6E|nr:uncharacterized protein J7T55_012908 [Diaporthe amygdali]KAJ0118654.1 hypothetical protein J7T55_012908 [Diaporthe amygdali]
MSQGSSSDESGQSCFYRFQGFGSQAGALPKKDKAAEPCHRIDNWLRICIGIVPRVAVSFRSQAAEMNLIEVPREARVSNPWFEISSCALVMVIDERRSLGMVESSIAMTPFAPPDLSQRKTQTSRDFLQNLQPAGSATDSTASGSTQRTQVTGLQKKANGNIQEDADGLESQVTPMTPALILQVLELVAAKAIAKEVKPFFRNIFIELAFLGGRDAAQEPRNRTRLLQCQFTKSVSTGRARSSKSILPLRIRADEGMMTQVRAVSSKGT